MKNLKSLFLIASLVPALGTMAQIEDYTLPDGKVVKIDRSVFPDLKYDVTPKAKPADYEARRKARKAKAQTQLPPYVYNGQDKYFPPIFNQDGGSCGSAAAVGYQFTHEINSYRDADASLPENQYPSHFTWLLAYQTSTTEGMAKAIGIPNVPTYGGRTYSRLFGPQTHDDPDYGWMQGYDKWFSAMWNKSAYDFSLAPTNTPEGRQELKEWLYNHSGDDTMHGGGVAGIGVAAYGTWGFIPSTDANDAAGVTNMKYVMKWGETYNHALTVCGYDDRIEFDLDSDGIIGEVEEDEVGAWIIANSWGDGWENKGFIYCPYKYSFAVDNDVWTWTPSAYVIRQDYRPLRTIKILMDYSRRSELLLSAGIAEDLSATRPEKTIPFEHFRYAGNTLGADPAPEVPMLGRWADGIHNEPMEFGYDLTDLTLSVDRTKPLKYIFIVKTATNAKGNGHIYNASIINYEIENEGVEIPFEQENVTIRNRGRETFISVVVPGEQLYPPSNLGIQDNMLVWSAPQASSLTLTGYHVYEGARLVAQLPMGQTSYTPVAGSSAAFTVRAVYQAGQYGQESAPSNAVVFEIPQQGANQIVNLDSCGIIIPGAINELLGQATIEFWMRNDKNTSYTHQVGPGWGKFLFHNSSNGTLSVGWDSSGSDRLNVSGVFSTLGVWNHIAIVINGKVLTLYVNGTKKGSITSSTYSGLVAFGDLPFGRTSDINQWWIGGLDEIRVWKTARTKDEISSNMYVRIAAPALQPDLLVYVPMETIEVDGKTMLREYVSGKHAYFQKIGTWEVVEDNTPFSGAEPQPVLSIVEEETTHLAGIPFRLKAQSSLNATSWEWTTTDSEQCSTCSPTETQCLMFNGMTPTFTFAEAGTYNICCEATFADGSTLTASKEIVVAEGEVPVANFDVLSSTLPAGDRFSFINRSEGSGCTYLWTMPGAEVEELSSTNATALYPQIGSFNVTLTATNPYGSSSVTKEVVVCASAPKARFDLSQTAIMLGEGVHLYDESRYSPLSWHWELNNGSRIYTVDEQSPYIIPTAPGIYDVSLYVTNELGENMLTNKRYLIVQNDDPLSCLNFTGTEQLQIPCPFAAEQSALTLDWWMQPSDCQGSVSISSANGGLSTAVDYRGMLSITLGGETAQSLDGYIVKNEWHHYAVTFDEGVVTFYRDGLFFCNASAALPAVLPAMESITANEGFKGQIDEVRLWGSALTEEKIKAYCNQHIEDVQAAEAGDNLLLYYDFNQNGGAVQDRASGGFNAQRIGFGPDGDAWNSALGVFTLDTEALMHGDISATYLTNYKNPYITASGTVNPNDRNRFLPLAMRTTTSKWRDTNAVTSGGITTGAHIDTAHHSDIQFETKWSGFAEQLLDYRLYQVVKLPAGRYRFSITPGDVDDMQVSRLVVSPGTSMVSDAKCEERAIAWAPLAEGTLDFELTESQTVSLGIIVNLSGQTSFGIHAFKLEGRTLEALVPTFDPDGIKEVHSSEPIIYPYSSDIYDLSGRKVSSGGLSPGIYIKDGRKQIVK